MKYKIEFCRGSGEGAAIYISGPDGGYRAFGPKCWGFIKTVKEFELTESNIDDAIKELRKVKRLIRKENKKKDKTL